MSKNLNHPIYIPTKKLVLFGARKIGCSFIAPLFSRGRYEVVFVDIDKNIIEALNKRRSYIVINKGEHEEKLSIRGVQGIFVGTKNRL